MSIWKILNEDNTIQINKGTDNEEAKIANVLRKCDLTKQIVVRYDGWATESFVKQQINRALTKLSDDITKIRVVYIKVKPEGK